MPGRVSIAIMSLVLVWSLGHSAIAQDVPDGETVQKGKVVRHKPLSGMPFPKATSSDQFLDTGMIYRLPKPSRNAKLKGVPKHNNYLMEIPRCKENATRRREVFQYSMQTASFDMTFYDPNDRQQVIGSRSAKGKLVPYRANRIVKLEKNKEDAFQLLALPLNVRCLPTRLRILMEDDRRFIEHREGENAWKQTVAGK